MRRRVTARFHPQAWADDYALDVDPEGPVEWDVTDRVLAMGRAASLALRDGSDQSDALRDAPGAPTWIRAWAGPFYVTVEESVRDYWGPESADPPRVPGDGGDA